MSRTSGGEFAEAGQTAQTEIGRANIAVLGMTGAGKSTLINAVFGETFADDARPMTGIGAPVTSKTRLYTNETGTIGLYDFPGIETGDSQKEILRTLNANVERNRKGQQRDLIHVAWYCIRFSDRRFDQVQADLIREIDKLGIPVIVILTQVPKVGTNPHPDAIALARFITASGAPLAAPVQLVAAIEDAYLGHRSHGLKELMSATFPVVADGVREALVAAQKVDLAQKKKSALAAIAAATAGAAGVGAIPVPGSDAAYIVPAQVALMARIAAIYGISMTKSSATSLAIATAASQVGRLAVTSASKLIPGFGSVISGSVAAVFTMALGEAWRIVCEKISTGAIDVKILTDNAELFRVFMGEFQQSITARGASV